MRVMNFALLALAFHFYSCRSQFASEEADLRTQNVDLVDKLVHAGTFSHDTRSKWGNSVGFKYETQLEIREDGSMSMSTSLGSLGSVQPTGEPTAGPTSPTGFPTAAPSGEPSSQPTGEPTSLPTGIPSGQPTSQPTRLLLENLLVKATTQLDGVPCNTVLNTSSEASAAFLNATAFSLAGKGNSNAKLAKAMNITIIGCNDVSRRRLLRPSRQLQSNSAADVDWKMELDDVQEYGVDNANTLFDTISTNYDTSVSSGDFLKTLQQSADDGSLDNVAQIETVGTLTPTIVALRTGTPTSVPTQSPAPTSQPTTMWNRYDIETFPQENWIPGIPLPVILEMYWPIIMCAALGLILGFVAMNYHNAKNAQFDMLAKRSLELRREERLNQQINSQVAMSPNATKAKNSFLKFSNREQYQMGANSRPRDERESRLMNAFRSGVHVGKEDMGSRSFVQEMQQSVIKKATQQTSGGVEIGTMSSSRRGDASPDRLSKQSKPPKIRKIQSPRKRSPDKGREQGSPVRVPFQEVRSPSHPIPTRQSQMPQNQFQRKSESVFPQSHQMNAIQNDQELVSVDEHVSMSIANEGYGVNQRVVALQEQFVSVRNRVITLRAECRLPAKKYNSNIDRLLGQPYLDDREFRRLQTLNDEGQAEIRKLLQYKSKMKV
jgi:hypothetical protein